MLEIIIHGVNHQEAIVEEKDGVTLLLGMVLIESCCRVILLLLVASRARQWVLLE